MNDPSDIGIGIGIGIGPATGRPLKILYVEDDDGDFQVVSRQIARSELQPPPEIHRSASMAGAVEKIAACPGDSPYDIVLLDLNLPDCPVPDTLTRLTGAASHIPITVLSGNGDTDLAVAMVQQGAQDYLTKDAIDARSIGRSILYAIERHRIRMKLAELDSRLASASAELSAAQMQLIQAEKLDSLGRLAA